MRKGWFSWEGVGVGEAAIKTEKRKERNNYKEQNHWRDSKLWSIDVSLSMYKFWDILNCFQLDNNVTYIQTYPRSVLGGNHYLCISTFKLNKIKCNLKFSFFICTSHVSSGHQPNGESGCRMGQHWTHSLCYVHSTDRTFLLLHEVLLDSPALEDQLINK